MGSTSMALHNGSPVMHLVDEAGNGYMVHWTPEQAQLGGFSNKYATIPRQGMKPLIRYDSSNLRTMSFTNDMPHMDGYLTTALRIYAQLAMFQGAKYRLTNCTDGLETLGWWHITDLTITIKERNEDQQPKLATVAWQFTEAVDERPAISHTPPPPPPPPPPAMANPPPPMQADYTVKSGDSLWKIAEKFLGDGTRWTELYELNKGRLNLKPPEQYKGLTVVWIYAGQIMQIPPR